jgi:hypothetical protein
LESIGPDPGLFLSVLDLAFQKRVKYPLKFLANKRLNDLFIAKKIGKKA